MNWLKDGNEDGLGETSSLVSLGLLVAFILGVGVDRGRCTSKGVWSEANCGRELLAKVSRMDKSSLDKERL